jgi:predicted ABC-type sugar transport system permease subunit
VSRLAAGLRSFAAFWWDFIVGDDWRIAAGVILALAATAALSRTSVPAWWLLPIIVAALLGISLRRATRVNHQQGHDLAEKPY